MRLRVGIGCLLALLAVALAGPPTWLPWAGWVRSCAPAWWQIPVLASGLLLLAAAAMPRTADAPLRQHSENIALGLGLLLLAEPPIHLATLAYLAWRTAPGAGDLLLPPHVIDDPMWLAPRLLVIGLLAPLAEEAFFRGRLLPYLAARIGRWNALSLTTLAFAVAHGSPVACVVALPVGLLLGWLRLTRGDVAACVVVHQAHNALLLIAGAGLAATPMMAMLLACSGSLLLALAIARNGAGWRALPIGLALAAALAMAVPLAVAIQDRLWGMATARLLDRAGADPAVMTARLDRELRRGRLTANRVDELRPRLAGAAPATLCARLLLDGANARAADVDEADALLRAALAMPEPSPRIAAAAGEIGIAWPGVLALIAVESPNTVAAWLGPDGALRAIAAAQGGSRRRLLAGLERAWPGRLASVLLRLPADGVTAMDRRHLRANYPDADDLIAALDPDRQIAWRR